MKFYDALCKPAQFYLVISVFAYVIMLLQNISGDDAFTLGAYSCPYSNKGTILFFNALYIIIWTWMLNLICRINPKISWFIVLFPFIMLFLALAVLFFKSA
jgi:hypothetical protein